MTGGLLAVHAHPDDETLSTGALLATWATAGLPVTVVTCTRGEQGEVIPDDLRHLEGAGEAFARHREDELARALAHLGVRDHLFLDEVVVAGRAPVRIVDSGMAWVHRGRAGAADDVPDGALVTVPLEEAARRLAGVLLARRPQVVATYEPGGGYGHPDHVRTHELTMRAVEIAVAEGLAPPVVLWAVLEREPWVEAVGELGATALPPGLVPLQVTEAPSAVTDGPVDVRVDVLPVRDRVLRALGAHATQVQAVEPLPGPRAVARFALSNAVVQPVLAVESYRVAAGEPDGVGWPPGVATAG